MKKYEHFSKEEILSIINTSKTYKEAMLKLGYAESAKTSILKEIAEKYNIDISKLTQKVKQKWQNFSDEEIISILQNSVSYKEALEKFGYQKNSTNCNYIIDNIAERYNISLNHFHRTGDITNNYYGHWKVIEKSNIKKDKQNSYWLCECSCGKKQIISYTNLTKNKTFSCGCIKKSKGEQLISNLLKEMDIDYIEQFSPNDINSYCNFPLYFDFYLPKFKIFIEYQGQQHYTSMGFPGGEERFKRQIKNDNIKREYCKENKYLLLEIPYTDYRKINKEYLQNLIKLNYQSKSD